MLLGSLPPFRSGQIPAALAMPISAARPGTPLALNDRTAAVASSGVNVPRTDNLILSPWDPYSTANTSCVLVAAKPGIVAPPGR